jgi:hypothetical protein
MSYTDNLSMPWTGSPRPPARNRPPAAPRYDVSVIARNKSEAAQQPSVRKRLQYHEILSSPAASRGVIDSPPI